MAIDSVNNNRTAVVTGTALAAGAGLGAAYGYKKANILEGNAPKDSFIRTLDRSKVAHDKRAIADEQRVLAKIANNGSLENVSNDIKAKLQKAAGGKKKLDISKAKPEEIKEIAKKLVLDENTRKAELEKLDKSSLSVLEAKAAKLKDVPEKATAEDLHRIIKNNHELFGIKKPEKGTLDEAVKEFTKDKELSVLKDEVTNVIKKEKTSLTNQINSRKNVIRKLFEKVYDITGKKMSELPKDASENLKSAAKTVKNAISNFKTVSAAKWGAAGATALGLTSFLTAKVMSRPAAKKDCNCSDCEEQEA